MNLAPNSGTTRLWILCAAAFLLAMAVAGMSRQRPDVMSRESRCAEKPVNVAGIAVPGTAGSSRNPEVKRYVMDFDGDHSLDLATVTEQVFAGYAMYTVQLHLASGADQSVVVAAPPGGLQIEMHDMTGDKVPNDLVLRPALFRWLPTVFVNDGHDHFALAISGTDPRFLSSSGDYGSQSRDCQSFALLMSSGFKTVALAIHNSIFGSQARRGFVSGSTVSQAMRLDHAASTGRAPPFVVSI